MTGRGYRRYPREVVSSGFSTTMATKADTIPINDIKFEGSKAEITRTVQRNGIVSIHHVESQIDLVSERHSHSIVLHSSSTCNELELAKLPNWPGVETTAPSVVWPVRSSGNPLQSGVESTPNSERVQIILDKVAQPQYSLSGALDSSFPAILTRDARRLLPQAHAIGLAGKRRREPESEVALPKRLKRTP
jgi:hypothetical protein